MFLLESDSYLENVNDAINTHSLRLLMNYFNLLWINFLWSEESVPSSGFLHSI
jgi:hypothetical protein